jgi:hypothetical protein
MRTKKKGVAGKLVEQLKQRLALKIKSKVRSGSEESGRP